MFYTGGYPLGVCLMSATTSQLDSQRLASPALRGFAWGVLAYFIASILWGTIVRATGSGDGCGNHWPLCNGTVVQPSSSLGTMIEFTHRVSAGAIGSIFVLGLLIWVWLETPAGHLARWFAGASVFFTLSEGFLGAMLVTGTFTRYLNAPLPEPMGPPQE